MNVPLSQIMKKIKMFNEFFLTFVLMSCAFTTNPREITVNNVAITFDSAD